MQSPHTNLSVMKLYILIQRFLGRKYVHYFVLFFILISIAAIIGSSYEEMAAYRLPLFGVTYVSSFVFLVEYIARILSAPALYPGRKAVKARLKYTFSFYGFVDFVAVLPCILTYIYWDTEVDFILIQKKYAAAAAFFQALPVLSLLLHKNIFLRTFLFYRLKNSL